MSAYYNEIEPYAAEWIRNLIAAGHVPAGDVDERSIVDVQPGDLAGYTQCHFFAGLGGWAYAARLAGWPDDRPIWTGSCPCQPFSVAGKGLGADDPRHLWPHLFRLASACRSPVLMGEQVAGAAGYGWFDGVRTDLAGEDYASRGVDIPACAVDAPHIRFRLYWIAVADEGLGVTDCDGWEPGQPAASTLGHGRTALAGGGHRGPVEHAPGLGWGEGRAEHELRGGRPAPAGAGGIDPGDACGAVANTAGTGGVEGVEAWNHAWDASDLAHRAGAGSDGRGARGGRNGTFWSDHEWLLGADGKSRRAQPGIRLLAHGVPARVAKLRALGNAIVPQEAAEVIAAFMECRP